MKRAVALFLTMVLCICSTVNISAKECHKTVEITDEITVQFDKETLLSALFEADIETIREAIDLRLITCRELTEYYLERIEEYNDTFNCFITLCDNALSEADKRDEQIALGTAQGSLFGVPIVVKDNIEYEGYYTTNGAKFSLSEISEKNAKVVQYLINEGAVIIGKSNMSYKANDARRSYSRAIGETYNAYNTKLASGGSSGGSAVATSLNFATASLGTDTNSSLRYPAALNGCISLRPTFGIIDREGCIILNVDRDTTGAITRTVKDQAIMLDVISGGGTYRENLNGNALEGVRIGVLKELSYPMPNVYGRKAANFDSEIQEAFANALLELEACGAEVVEVSLPKIFTLSANCDEAFTGWKSAKTKFYNNFEKLLTDNNVVAVVFPTYVSAPLYTGKNSPDGLSVYDQIWVSNCSVLSSPMGIPEISIPIGIHSRGAGIGMEIASLKNSEQLLLDIAYTYTNKFSHRVVPYGAPDIYENNSVGNLKQFISIYLMAQMEVDRLKEEEELKRLEEEKREEQEKMTQPQPETEATIATEYQSTSAAVDYQEVELKNRNFIIMIAGVMLLFAMAVIVIEIISNKRGGKH